MELVAGDDRDDDVESVTVSDAPAAAGAGAGANGDARGARVVGAAGLATSDGEGGSGLADDGATGGAGAVVGGDDVDRDEDDSDDANPADDESAAADDPDPGPDPDDTDDGSGLVVENIVIDILGGSPRAVEALVQVTGAQLCDSIVPVPATSGDVRRLKYELEIGVASVCQDGTRIVRLPLGRLDQGLWELEVGGVIEQFDVPAPSRQDQDDESDPDENDDPVLSGEFELEVIAIIGPAGGPVRLGYTPTTPSCLDGALGSGFEIVAADKCPGPLPVGTQWYGTEYGFTTAPLASFVNVQVDDQVLSFQVHEPNIDTVAAVGSGNAYFDPTSDIVRDSLDVRVTGSLPAGCARVESLDVIEVDDGDVATRMLVQPGDECFATQAFDVTSAPTRLYFSAEQLLNINGRDVPVIVGDHRIPDGESLMAAAEFEVDEAGDGYEITVRVPVERSVPCSIYTLQGTPFGTAYTPGAPPEDGVWYVFETWWDTAQNQALCPAQDSLEPVSFIYPVAAAGDWDITINGATRTVTAGDGEDPDQCTINGVPIDSLMSAAECDVIERIRDSGPGWELSGWDSTSDPCTWSTLTCGPTGLERLELVDRGRVVDEIGELTNLQVLQLQERGIRRIPEFIRQLNKLRELQVLDNPIVVLPEWLNDLPELELLSIDGDVPALRMPGVRTLELGSFEYYTQEWLDFNPGIDRIVVPGRIDEVRRVLDLENWSCSTFAEWGIECMKLANPAQCVIDGFAVASQMLGRECIAIEAMRDVGFASWGQLNSTGDPCGWRGVVCGVTGLEELDLADRVTNQTVPREIGELTNLTVLNLQENNLTELPLEMRGLTSLRRLVLDQNNFDRYQSLDTLPSLRELVVDHDLELELWDPSDIDSLWVIGGTAADMVPWILRYLSVEDLTMSFTGDGPLAELALMPYLTSLSGATWSQLAAASPGLGQLEELRVAGISGEVPPEGIFSNLSSLRVLDVRGVNVASLPADLGALTSLEEVLLGRNFLTELPPSLGGLDRLRVLDLEYNALRNVDVAALAPLTDTLVDITLADTSLDINVPPFGVQGNDCLTSSDPTLGAWLDVNDPGWDDCGQ